VPLEPDTPIAEDDRVILFCILTLRVVALGDETDVTMTADVDA
jgi:hypothetical protein